MPSRPPPLPQSRTPKRRGRSKGSSAGNLPYTVGPIWIESLETSRDIIGTRHFGDVPGIAFRLPSVAGLLQETHGRGADGIDRHLGAAEGQTGAASLER